MPLERLAVGWGRLTYRAESESVWDRLTALCMGAVASDRRVSREAHLNALGVSLIAYKHSGQDTYRLRAIDGLQHALRWKAKGLTTARRLRIAQLTVHEWVSDACEPCTGSKIEIDGNGVQRPCSACSLMIRGELFATGKKRYSDRERTDVLGEDAKPYAQAIGIAHGLISMAVDGAERAAVEMLK